MLLELVKTLLNQTIVRVLFRLKLRNRGLHLTQVRFNLPETLLRLAQSFNFFRKYHHFLLKICWLSVKLLD